MIQPLLQGVFDRLSSFYLGPSIKLFKTRTAIHYLKGIKAAHRVLMLNCLLVFVITLFGAGLVVIPLTLLLFMPWELTTKVMVGISVGVIYLMVPAVSLLTLLSEKRWMRITGATNMLHELEE